MRYLKSQDNLPWLCAGDFNEVLAQHEHLGVNQRSQTQMSAFQDCLDDCGLTDLGFKGYEFTWNNRLEGPENVQCRLDRGTATVPFMELFPFTSVEHIATKECDHMALLIKVRDAHSAAVVPHSRGFKFEEMWLKHDNYEDMVKTVWESRRGGRLGLDNLWRQLCEVSADLQRRGYETFGVYMSRDQVPSGST
jgi:hypothetical protein